MVTTSSPLTLSNFALALSLRTENGSDKSSLNLAATHSDSCLLFTSRSTTAALGTPGKLTRTTSFCGTVGGACTAASDHASARSRLPLCTMLCTGVTEPSLCM